MQAAIAALDQDREIQASLHLKNPNHDAYKCPSQSRFLLLLFDYYFPDLLLCIQSLLLLAQSLKTIPKMPMYTFRTLNGPPSEFLDPAFRPVDFRDDPAVVIVSTHLRHAWTALPPIENPDEESVFSFIKANHALPPEQRTTLVPQNEDKDTVKTPWRERVHDRWNSVFVDVSSFLQGVGPGIGHFRTRDEVWGIDFPKSHSNESLHNGEEEKAAIKSKKVWDTNVLLIPAHLEPDVSLRATITRRNEEGNEEEAPLGTFDASNLTECWYLKRGIQVNFYVEGDAQRNGQGTAAVLAVGLMCLEDHGRAPQPEEDGDGEQQHREETAEKTAESQ